jgi:hypothetical protein
MKIAYGNADFATIRKSGAFYVDKTPFLPMLESFEFGSQNILFLRPRRFGKSSLISMMEHYYDIHLSDQVDELFQGLWIHEHPTPEKSKYMVLHLDFSQLSAHEDEDVLRANFLDAVKISLVSLFQRYASRIPMIDRVVQRLDSYTDPAALIGNVLGTIASTKDSLYVMIDEYDTLAISLLSAEQKDVYSKVTDKMGFVRAFYRTLKAGTQTGAIARVFITGGTPILLDDILTGFNVATNISNDRHFNTLAGFTEADVVRAVDELLQDNPTVLSIPEIGDRQKLLHMLEEFFDGYRFARNARERVFNSTMVLYFLRELDKNGEFPAEILDPNARTDYRKLHSLWAGAGAASRRTTRSHRKGARDGRSVGGTRGQVWRENWFHHESIRIADVLHGYADVIDGSARGQTNSFRDAQSSDSGTGVRALHEFARRHSGHSHDGRTRGRSAPCDGGKGGHSTISRGITQSSAHGGECQRRA